MGSVAVSVVLPESTGAIDPDSENWDSARQSTVITKVVSALNWWVGQYPYSMAHLSFTYVYRFGVPTGYEPIIHPKSEQGLWISEVMTALGHTATASTIFTAVTAYDNELRDSQKTDWAFTIFVADSLNHTAGEFPDGWFAYAYIGGPFVVMTYGNDGWGIDRMDQVLVHEMGHIFRAGDEYCKAGYSCCDATGYYGYLNVLNSNCGSGVSCVMNDNSTVICPVTRQQLGWRDSDGDGCPDILDVPPTVTLTPYAPDPTSNAMPIYTGSASVSTYPNQLYSGADVTVNRIAGVEFRVDGGAWRQGAASDGAFDGGTEAYTFTTPAMPTGTHTVEVRAVDSSGNATRPPYPSDSLTVEHPHYVAVTAAATLTPIWSQSTTQLTAVAEESMGHGIAAWAWDDGGAGGTFVPSPTVQNPTYTAPVRVGMDDLKITLTVAATCDGTPAVTGRDSAEIVIHDFTDVPYNYWAVAEIYACYRAGIASGYPDGSYQPGEPVARDQMAVYISRAVAGGRPRCRPPPPARASWMWDLITGPSGTSRRPRARGW